MSPSPHIAPIVLEPRFDPKIWGGRRLETVLGKSLPDGQRYGESLESDDDSRIVDGPHAGLAIRDVIAQHATSILGERGIAASGQFSDFPLLAKFIDATNDLSIQVHPNDVEAASLGKRGKTEAWHIIAADPGARLITGIKQGVSLQQVEQAIAEVNLGEFLIEETVQAGDTLMVPAGTTHAIGAGILLYEIQQASDVTYRMYDWGRLDDAGNPRDLHVAESLAVLKPDLTAEKTRPLELGTGQTMLTACRFFALERWEPGQTTIQRALSGGTFMLVSVVSGAVSVGADSEVIELSAGQTALIPAAARTLNVTGDGVLLLSYVPDLQRDAVKPLQARGHSAAEIAQLAGNLPDLQPR